MGSIVQNGWDQRASQYVGLAALTLLYYDYAITFDRERRLFWSQRNPRRWGSIMFFFNRYFGVIGHVPVFIQLFARPGSTLYSFCKPVRLYHQILAIIMQAIIACTFITRTYALYNKSRAVLVGLASLALAYVAIGGCMLFRGGMLVITPVLPEGSIGCAIGLTWSQSWHLAVVWSGPVVFDFTVVVMTLARTVRIYRWSGGGQSLTRVIIRDGAMYFGLVTLSNIITFLYGSELTRGVMTTATNSLASVLVSRLMFNIRERMGNSVGQSQPPLQFQLGSRNMATSVDEYATSGSGWHHPDHVLQANAGLILESDG